MLICQVSPWLFYGNYANTAKQDAYQTVNLRLGYEGERYDIVLWCKNLFDEEYLTYVASSGSSYSVGVDGMPQMFGLTVTYRF
ncbi:TonB-dependent receptor [uncultured Desulfobacter sp.]|uniref:TonB-dependent receptor n=1 Tax=uncultured Desulfobacter sp. TaxID=240139 RepID=UPI002AA861A6|nr:TonB-dependent receptor [uncultured Desulfobacter sp.]